MQEAPASFEDAKVLEGLASLTQLRAVTAERFLRGNWIQSEIDHSVI